MTTAQLLPPTGTCLPADLGVAEEWARISFRQPVSPAGFIDAAWWPRTLDLTAELPPLVDVLWTAGREINRITYHLLAWDPAPRRVQIQGRTVRLGGFTVGDPHTVTLTDPWGHERIDILVITPSTDPAIAQRIFDIASAAEDPYRADDILDRANRTTTAHG
jgi:hypothetical protein